MSLSDIEYDCNESGHNFDGGFCLECDEPMLCILCENNDWEGGCNLCNDGRYLCSECITLCDKCGNYYCIVCGDCCDTTTKEIIN